MGRTSLYLHGCGAMSAFGLQYYTHVSRCYKATTLDKLHLTGHTILSPVRRSHRYTLPTLLQFPNHHASCRDITLFANDKISLYIGRTLRRPAIVDRPEQITPPSQA
jgi:hypothetical protein